MPCVRLTARHALPPLRYHHIVYTAAQAQPSSVQRQSRALSHCQLSRQLSYRSAPHKQPSSVNVRPSSFNSGTQQGLIERSRTPSELPGGATMGSSARASAASSPQVLLTLLPRLAGGFDKRSTGAVCRGISSGMLSVTESSGSKCTHSPDGTPMLDAAGLPDCGGRAAGCCGS